MDVGQVVLEDREVLTVFVATDGATGVVEWVVWIVAVPGMCGFRLLFQDNLRGRSLSKEDFTSTSKRVD